MLGFHAWKAQRKVPPTEVPPGKQREPLSAANARGAMVPELDEWHECSPELCSRSSEPLLRCPG